MLIPGFYWNSSQSPDNLDIYTNDGDDLWWWPYELYEAEIVQICCWPGLVSLSVSAPAPPLVSPGWLPGLRCPRQSVVTLLGDNHQHCVELSLSLSLSSSLSFSELTNGPTARVANYCLTGWLCLSQIFPENLCRLSQITMLVRPFKRDWCLYLQCIQVSTIIFISWKP